MAKFRREPVTVWSFMGSRKVLSKLKPTKTAPKNPELASFLNKMDALQASSFESVNSFNAIMLPHIQGASRYINSPELFNKHLFHFMLDERAVILTLKELCKRRTGEVITDGEIKAYFRKVAESMNKPKTKK